MAAGRVTRSIERAENESQLRALLQTDAARHMSLPKKEA
jgi:hypothetical protein